ncbi:MAG: RNA-binding domain-containing protein [Acutalibacter sp.]|jgi:ATP-dependent DNA helicase RecG
MIDFAHLEHYRENNRIEAKKALGGLPESIWETYSAFANTMGGLILLGVIEEKNKSLHAVGVPDPQWLMDDFWERVTDPTRVSANILSQEDVFVEEVEGKPIVVIQVPRAHRQDRPVYLNENPLRETYRRNGEGDCRCTREEVQTMLRDAAAQSQDMRLLKELGLEALDFSSLHRYRRQMELFHPGHVWEQDEDPEFLYKIGAAGRDHLGVLHPTGAGLLMFGFAYEIVKEYPLYFLDYREELPGNSPWAHRVVSTSGEWSGNLFDFYSLVSGRFSQDSAVSANTSVGEGLKEALANCLVNADYYGHPGVVIVKKPQCITFSNPGGFRVGLDTARSGGTSDPRNAALIKLFNLIDVGHRTGSGIPNLFSLWNRMGWPPPVIRESFDPARITLTLWLQAWQDSSGPSSWDRFSGTSEEAHPAQSGAQEAVLQKAVIVDYLTENPQATFAQIGELLGTSPEQVRKLLDQMMEEGTVEPQGETGVPIYRLKD